MATRKIPSSFRWDPDQKRTLELISRHTRGTPHVSRMVREAIEQYIQKVFLEDPILRDKVVATLAAELDARKEASAKSRKVAMWPVNSPNRIVDKR